MPGNLLRNPNGDEGLKYWELTKNGGDQWRTEDMPGDGGYPHVNESIKKYFCTSFQLCLKRQVIDLLARGYNREQLDNRQPTVTVEDWYSGRKDCGCSYQIIVSLLDEHHKVINEFRPKEAILDPDNNGCSWRNVMHTFKFYGPGLRFISFEHGGRDTKFWKGWYGVRVTGSSVTVDL